MTGLSVDGMEMLLLLTFNDALFTFQQQRANRNNRPVYIPNIYIAVVCKHKEMLIYAAAHCTHIALTFLVSACLAWFGNIMGDSRYIHGVADSSVFGLVIRVRLCGKHHSFRWAICRSVALSSRNHKQLTS